MLRDAGWNLGPGPGREGSGAEWTVSAGCRSAKFTAGAEEPPAPGPAPHAGSPLMEPGQRPPLRLNRSERGHSFSLASGTNLDPGALSQSFPKVAAEPVRAVAYGMHRLGESSKLRSDAEDVGGRLRSSLRRQWPFRLNPLLTATIPVGLRKRSGASLYCKNTAALPNSADSKTHLPPLPRPLLNIRAPGPTLTWRGPGEGPV